MTDLECVCWLAAGKDEESHENREQHSHRAHRTDQEITAHLGRGAALHIWAKGQHCTFGKGQHCRAALPGGAGGRRKGEIQVEHHCGESRACFAV